MLIIVLMYCKNIVLLILTEILTLKTTTTLRYFKKNILWSLIIKTAIKFKVMRQYKISVPYFYFPDRESIVFWFFSWRDGCLSFVGSTFFSFLIEFGPFMTSGAVLAAARRTITCRHFGLQFFLRGRGGKWSHRILCTVDLSNISIAVLPCTMGLVIYGVTMDKCNPMNTPRVMFVPV